MITTESGMVECGCRSAGECSHNTFAEVKAFDLLVDKFADEMKMKFFGKWRQGCSGWDAPASAENIRSALLAHVQRGAGQETDIAIYAAMLWNFQQVAP